GTDFFSNLRTAFGRLEMNGFLPGSSGMAGSGSDAIPPAVVLTSDTPLAIRSGTIDFTATFSEPVFGFRSAGVAATNGTVTSFTQVDASTYRFSVSPSGEGTVTTSVNAGAAFDFAGNRNLASAPVARTFDTTAPTVTANDLLTNDT